MDDEHDDFRELEELITADTRAESDDLAETEDREKLGMIEEPPVSEVPEEPVYTPEEYQLAQEIKSKRLYKEEHNRFPQTAGELSYFLMKANIERPLKPDDEDLQAARRKLEAAGS
jgi:hypothetical protein